MECEREIEIEVGREREREREGGGEGGTEARRHEGRETEVRGKSV